MTISCSAWRKAEQDPQQDRAHSDRPKRKGGQKRRCSTALDQKGNGHQSNDDPKDIQAKRPKALPGAFKQLL
ncbi:MAG: hypothetical protein AAFV25_19165, partial [Bacteroidota bacterium]